MNRATTYITIGVIGSVISLLYFTLGSNPSMGFFFIFTTVYALAATRFVLEWRYYRRHNAILASLQFVALPFVVVLTGMLLSFRINMAGIIGWSITPSLVGNFSSFLINPISLSLILPVYLLYRFFFNYHARRWLGFAINNRIFGKRLVPYLINTIMAVSLLYLAYLLPVIDGVAFITPVIWVVHSFKYYIIPFFRSFRRRPRRTRVVERPRRRSITEPTRRPNSISSRLSGNYDSYIEPAKPTRKKRKRGAPVSTRPSSGYREISTTSSRSRKPKTEFASARQPSPSSRRTKKEEPASRPRRTTAKATRKPTRKATSKPRTNKKTTSRSRSSSIEVDPGREVRTMSRSVESLISDDPLIPSGKIDKSDLNCIFCYEPIKSGDKNVVLCPSCKYPGHEDEYLSWIQVSNLCARCSKPIPRPEKPKLRLSAKEYIKKVVNKV